MIFYFVTFFIFVNFLLFYFVKFFCFNINLVDKPDGKKKIHKKIVPLGGGIVLIINVLIYYLLSKIFSKHIEYDFFTFKEEVSFYIGCFLIFLVGIIDDKIDFNPYIKFFLLIISLIVVLMFSEQVKLTQLNFSFISKKFDLSILSLVVTTICYLCFLNAFNMFDGINLQCSIFSIIIFIFFINLNFDIFLFSLLIYLIFFAYYNYKNLIFLGDSGSLLLSFIMGFIFIKLFNENKIIYADQIFLLMSLPGIDMIRLFILRILNKKNPFKGDLNHIHHVITKNYSHKIYYLIIGFLILVPNIIFIISKNFLFSFLFFLVLYLFFIFQKKIN